MAFVAGCGSSGDGGDGSSGDEGDSSGDSDDQGRVDRHFRHGIPTSPSEKHFNVWNPQNNLSTYMLRWLWDSPVQFAPGTQEYYPQLVEDWEIDNSELTLSVREGISWHSGEALTAEDVVNDYRLGKVLDYPVWDYAESVEATDEYTVTFELTDAVNSNLVLDQVLRSSETIATHPELHREFIERQQDATTDSELEDLSNDLLTYEIEPEDAIETIGNGPVQLVDVSDQHFTLDVYDEYPIGWTDGNDLNFQGVRLDLYSGAESGTHEAAITDEIDALTGSTSESVREQFADHWDLVGVPQFWGHGIFFSPESKWGEDTERGRKLRQAVAHLYNPEEWVEIYGSSVTDYPADNNVTGLANPQQQESWLSDVIDEFTDYGNPDSGWHQPDRAAELLRDAGYERDADDMWVDAETGERLTGPVKYPGGWSAVVPAMSNIAEQLNRFGIESEALGQENTSFFGEQVPSGDFEITTVLYGEGPHPYVGFRLGAGIGTLSNPAYNYNNGLSEVTVPWPVGEQDGDLETVNYDERVQELARTDDPEREQELVEEIAWIVNQWVGGIAMENRTRMHYASTQHFDYNREEVPDDLYRSENMWAHLARTGDLSAK